MEWFRPIQKCLSKYSKGDSYRFRHEISMRVISCLYWSYTSSKTFHVGLQTVICFEGIQSIYFSADTNPPFITLRFHNHFLHDFSRVCQNLRSSWSTYACFISRHVFLWSTRLLRLRRFWGQRKGHMNITERCEGFVRDVKNYFPDSFSNFFPFPLHFYVEKIWTCTGRFGNIPFHLSKLRIPKFT